MLSLYPKMYRSVAISSYSNNMNIWTRHCEKIACVVNDGGKRTIEVYHIFFLINWKKYIIEQTSFITYSKIHLIRHLRRENVCDGLYRWSDCEVQKKSKGKERKSGSETNYTGDWFNKIIVIYLRTWHNGNSIKFCVLIWQSEATKEFQEMHWSRSYAKYYIENKAQNKVKFIKMISFKKQIIVISNHFPVITFIKTV